MNGVHDLGGMHGMGPVQAEQDEPVFHSRWEARAFALTRMMGAWGKWNIDASRYQRELIPGADSLRMSYYEKWIAGLCGLLVKSGLVTQAELESGKRDAGSAIATPKLMATDVAAMIAKGIPASRNVAAVARFHTGQRVRARNINPVGHTRLPRYTRGKSGVIQRDHGVFVFPDTNAQFLGENPQHVYSVRFAARELWGSQALPEDSVYVDLWDAYLEPA